MYAKLSIFKEWEEKQIEPTALFQYRPNTIIYKGKKDPNIVPFGNSEGTWELRK